jgi:hypothetical protein
MILRLSSVMILQPSSSLIEPSGPVPVREAWRAWEVEEWVGCLAECKVEAGWEAETTAVGVETMAPVEVAGVTTDRADLADRVVKVVGLVVKVVDLVAVWDREEVVEADSDPEAEAAVSIQAVEVLAVVAEGDWTYHFLNSLIQYFR